MIDYDVSETIQAPPDRVFRFLSSVESYPTWMNVSQVEVVGPGGSGKGLQWRGQTREGDFLVENDDFEENRLVGFHTLEGPFSWTGGFRLDGLEDGSTRVTSYGQISTKGFRRLLEPLMAGQVRKGEAAELVKLRALAEAKDTDTKGAETT